MLSTDGRFDISESNLAKNLFKFTSLLLSPTVLGKQGKADSVTMSHSTPDMKAESLGSSTKKIKSETNIEMPDYNKQYNFIKYWMFTSPLSPNAAPSTFNTCFEAVTAEFGPDALTREQVHVFHSDSLFSKILTFSFLG